MARRRSVESHFDKQRAGRAPPKSFLHAAQARRRSGGWHNVFSLFSFHTIVFSSRFRVAALRASITTPVSVVLDESQCGGVSYMVAVNGREHRGGGGATAGELISPRLVCRSRLCCFHNGFWVKSDIKLISMLPAGVQVQAAPSAPWTMSGGSACDWPCTHKQTPGAPKNIFRQTHTQTHAHTHALGDTHVQKDNSRPANQNSQGRLSNYPSWLFVFVCGLTHDALGW